MRASRLLSILILLQARGRLTAEALAAEFEVSVRTVYRDIDDLSAAGVPVYAERGPGGGFRLLDGYRTTLTGLSDAEAAALFVIGLPDAARALGLGAAAGQAGGKLLAALPPALGDSAARLRERVHVDPVDWYRAAPPAPALPLLARAVLDGRTVAMRYESWQATRDWEVEPLGLVLKGGGWYLVARGHGRIRMFRVAMIAAAALGERPVERPADFDLAEWWTAEIAAFEARLRPLTATLRLPAEAAPLLRREGAHAEAALAAADVSPDGSRQIALPVESLDQAARLVLGLGPGVEVLDPPDLRERVAAMAQAIAATMAKAEEMRASPA
jgi:predicted DNA-binding transcriptional regulator YafY